LWMQAAEGTELLWVSDQGDLLVLDESGEVLGQMSLCVSANCVVPPGESPQAPYARIADIAVASDGGAWALRRGYVDDFGSVGAQALLRLSDALDVEQEIDVSAWGLNDYARLLSAPEGPRFVVTPHEENGHQLTWISSDAEGNRTQHVLLQVAPDYSLGKGNTVRSVRMSDGGWVLLFMRVGGGGGLV